MRSKPRRSLRDRRLLLLGTGVVAAFLVTASVAWSCTLLIGTLTVCEPPSSTTNCSERTGSGSQVGLAEVDDAGEQIKVKGENFSTGGPPPLGTKYSIMFRAPGSLANCHRHAPLLGVTSLLGVNSLGQPNTVDGPDFEVTPTTPSTGGALGEAKICVQDEPEVVDGNLVTITIV